MLPEPSTIHSTRRLRRGWPFSSEVVAVGGALLRAGVGALGGGGAEAGGEGGGADDETLGVRVEVGEVALAGRFGVGADDVAGRQEVGEIAGVVRDAAAADTQGDGEQKQAQNSRAHGHPDNLPRDGLVYATVSG